MFKKQFLTVIVLVITMLSFIFVKPANTALETQLLVDVSPSPDNVPYTQTQWYGFNAVAGKGYCAILSPLTGNSDLYLFDTNFNQVSFSKNSGTNQDRAWYGQSSSGPLHIACYGVYNPSSNFTIQVITAPYVKTINPNSGATGILVTLTGFGFGDTRGTSYVKFGTVTATNYSSWTNTQIKVYVPTGVTSGTIRVVLYVATRASNPINFTVSGFSSDGTMWRYDLARTGNYPNGPTTLPLNLKWSYYTNWAVSCASTIANNILYIALDKLYAVDANTGILKWSYPVGWGSPPAVAGGIVYVGGGANTLYAIDANTGALKWKFVDPYGGTIYCTPAVFNNIVYFSTEYRFYALDAITGSVKWSYVPSGQIYRNAFAIANGVIYFGDSSHKVYALYANNGAVKWTYTMTYDLMYNQTPVVVNGILYFGAGMAGRSLIYALDANTGALKWQNYGYKISYLAISNGMLYASSGPYSSQGLFAFDANTGATKWSVQIQGTGPVVSKGLVFISSYDNNLYALDADTGSIKWSSSINGNGGDGAYHSPVIYNGKVYIGSSDGKLYCFGQ